MMRKEYYPEKLVLAANQNIKEKNFWLNTLSGEPVKSNFPYDFKKTCESKRKPERIKFEFPPKLFSKLIAASNQSDHAIHIILAANLIGLLYKYTDNSKDIIIGSSIYKQEIKGNFINTVLPLKTGVRGNMTYKELLMQVKQTVVDAVENQNYPVEKLTQELNLPVTAEDDFPLFDTAILLENIHDRNDIQHINPNVIFSFLRTEGTLKGEVEYNSLRYEKTTIERIALHFTRLLQETLFNVDSEISGIDILSPEEKKWLLVDLNNTKTPYPDTMSIQTLFEIQVEKAPDKIAVVYRDNQLTYKELNNKANRIALHLRARGVKPDHIVGIMIDPSLEMIIGRLGILKAGGAYFPLDAKSPLTRIISKLEDCSSKFLITRKNIHETYSFTSLQNLRAKKIKPFFTTHRPQICNLDQLPIPNRSLINYEKYDQYIGQSMVKNSLCIQASRGCPYHCVYCHKIWPKTHVFRSAEHIYTEVKLYYDMGVRRFTFIDDIFNLDQKNSSRFFELIIKNGLDIHIFYPNGVRADILTKEYIDLMVEAGTREVSFALETASPRLQKLIKKNLNLEKFRENLHYMINKHPHVIVDLFTMHGFPTETKEEAMMTLDFIKSMKWIHFPYIWLLKVFPDTEMEKLALENGITPGDIAASEDRAYHELPETLPFEKSFTLQYRADFFNNYFLSKARLLHVLPYQMKLLREDELIKKWKGYLPKPIYSLAELLQFLGIKAEELKGDGCRPDDYRYPPHLYQKMKAHFPQNKANEDALRILLLDLSQFFSEREDAFFDTAETPLGLMYLLTYLDRQLGAKVKGRVAYARIDFDNFVELKELLDEFKPDVIGIRALNYHKNFHHKIIAAIRQFGYNGPIIAGGPYATTNCQSILQDKNVDLVVLGEGEVTFCELIQKIIENGGHLPESNVLKTIAGIVFIPRERGIEEKFAPEIVMVEAFDAEARQKPVENPININRSADLAYVIYTSGSTGRPKGVMVEHKNVARLVKNSNYINLEKEDRLVLTGALGFDITTFEIWAPLLNGMSLYLPDKDVILDAKRFKELMEKNRITILHLIPQLFNQLAAQQPGIFAGLKYFLVGGDVVSSEYLNKIKKEYKGLKILHMYGPTENTTFSTFLPVHKDYEANIPIGKPIGNSRVYIVDKNNTLQPIGVPGELWLAGHGIARGYLNRPELTAEKFIRADNRHWSLVIGTTDDRSPSPHHPTTPSLHAPYSPYSTIYKTGDLARWLPDGNIEFLGRIDHQLKIRGFRIELGEIENILHQHNEIEESVVVSRKMYKENQLIAYYKKKNKIELWPTMAEYFAYDDLLYHAMAHDESRNETYKKAIQKVVKDKVVLEIGPGNEAILARMCIEAGAAKVYAVEILEDAYNRAREIVKERNLEDKIFLIHGDITKVKLPEKVDCCVSEIVGSIGGSEGVAKLINSARNQLKDPRCMIPSRSVTNIAAITLPPGEFDLSFEEVGAHYVEKIFAHTGRKFDLRLCLLSFPQKNLISNLDIFEELDFTRENELEDEHEILLEIKKKSVLNGFIVWLHLYCDQEEMIDTLAKKYIWLPIYFPVFFEGEAVQKGDYIKAKVLRKLSQNKLNPDYILKGTLYKKKENKSIDFVYHSPHITTEFKGNIFYKKIFAKDKLKVAKDVTPTDIRGFLARELPDYMIPSYFVKLDEIPLMSSGKIDRKALPIPEKLNIQEDLVGPRNELEQRISDVWKEILGCERVGIYNNFFEIGGNSLKAMTVVSKLSNDIDISINHLFQYGTVAAIAENVTWKKSSLKTKIEEIKESLRIPETKAELARDEFETQRKHVEEEYKVYLQGVEKETLPSLSEEQDYGHILLTGASGYLGAHMVQELVNRTGAVLHLLVRGNSLEHAQERLKKRLNFYIGEGFYEAKKKRLHVVQGDLKKEKMGIIDDLLYEKLSKMVNAVVHTAANVKHFGNYDDFYQDNVLASEKALEFSLAGIKKDFHHISTMGVGNANVEGKRYLLFTEFCHHVGQKYSNVYDQSKLEAEQKVLFYREKGLNTSIYRVGSLLFNSKTGKFQENIEESGFYAQLKTYITLGKVPEMNIMYRDMTFIDQAAEALVMLMTRKNLLNGTYHLANFNRLHWHEMVPYLNQCGINVEVVKLVEFLDYLSGCIETDNHRELVDRLLLHSGLLNKELEDMFTSTIYTYERTLRILQQLGFEWIKPNENHFRKMIEHCQQIGFL